MLPSIFRAATRDWFEVFRMYRRAALLSRCVLLTVLLCWLTVAQDTTGTITGVVQDRSGASVPGVQVKILNTETGFSRTVETSSTGEYKVPFIPVGFYSVTVQKAGFKTQQQNAVRIEILSTRTINFSLELGSTSETVQVASQVPLLDLETSQAGTVIKTEQVSRLPLN